MALNSSSRRYDIITFGDLGVDLIINGDDVVPEFGQVEKLVGDYTLEMGGSCSIFACQAAKLGLRVGILGRVGKDSFGDLILSRLNEYGVDTQYILVDPALKTGMGIALCRENDRAILTYMGTINAVEPGDVHDEFLASARHLHHGSYFLHTRLRPHIVDIFRRSRQLGLSISLDTNWDPEEEWGADLRTAIPLVDVFMPNEQEALHITGCSDLGDAAGQLHRMGAGIVAIKLGVKGAMLYDGRMTYQCSVEPVTGGDSIGAGDSFDAGFLAGWLRHLPLETCLEIACRCGRSVAGAIGGLKGQPDWKTVQP